MRGCLITTIPDASRPAAFGALLCGSKGFSKYIVSLNKIIEEIYNFHKISFAILYTIHIYHLV